MGIVSAMEIFFAMVNMFFPPLRSLAVDHPDPLIWLCERGVVGFSTAEESNAFYRRNLAMGQKGLRSAACVEVEADKTSVRS